MRLKLFCHVNLNIKIAISVLLAVNTSKTLVSLFFICVEIGMTRFELTTPWTQIRCATKLRHIPLRCMQYCYLQYKQSCYNIIIRFTTVLQCQIVKGVQIIAMLSFAPYGHESEHQCWWWDSNPHDVVSKDFESSVSAIPPHQRIIKANNRNRTYNLLITKQLLCLLSYVGISS